MKKIALASAAMGGAALIAFGASGTFASFTDQATVTSSAASAGSLEISATESATASIGGEDMAPGATATRTFKLTNSGEGVTAVPSVQVLSIANQDDGCTSKSEEAVDECWTAADGDLAAQIDLGYTTYPVNSDGSCANPSRETFAPLGRLATTGPLSDPRVSLGAGQSLCAAFQLTFVNSGDNNKAQGDSFTADVRFALTQV